ncbi:MAG: RecX family transcriptional regulator [Chloroflexota bacterium]|nr:RecX family transcriptional regulator [Chloroflexota bacterium]MDQ5866478.1 RecX family transcriptional regulator [Chloroflexota bacterium]
MADLITALQADPADPNRVHVFIDGKHAVAVSLDVAANERLTVGQTCPPQRLEQLHQAQAQDDIYQKALAFLSYRPRSAREVEQRLRRKGFTPEQVSGVMERLRSQKYIDDHEFARFWVGNRMTFNPRGPRLLRSELRQKGVPSDIVEEVMKEQVETQEELVQQAEELKVGQNPGPDEPVPGTDLANALALARKRLRTYGNLEPQVARRRLSSFLARRGYGFDVIDQVWRRVSATDEDEEYELFDD